MLTGCGVQVSGTHQHDDRKQDHRATLLHFGLGETQAGPRVLDCKGGSGSEMNCRVGYQSTASACGPECEQDACCGRERRVHRGAMQGQSKSMS